MKTAGTHGAALPSRGDFDLAPGIAYLNAGAYGPLSRASLEAGVQAIRLRARPWKFDNVGAAAAIDHARELVGNLIGARSQDMAVVSSVSHGAAIAANALPAQRGARMLRLAGEHPSNSLPWASMVARGCVEEVVPEPSDGNWTAALLEALERRSAAPVAVATFAPYHWADGARVDLEQVIPAVRRQGGAVFIDATQVAGAEAVDVARHRPDFVAFPLFKWLMGPYGMAFLYADPARQNGEPTDRSATNSRLTADLAWGGFAEGARRYDRGERDDYVSAAIASCALQQTMLWGVERIAAHVQRLGDALYDMAENAGLGVLPAAHRAPHIVGIRLGAGHQAAQVVETLAARGIVAAERRGVLRVTPHIYNDESDIEAFWNALRSELGK